MSEDYEFEVRVFIVIRKFVQVLDDRVFVLVIERIGHVIDDNQRGGSQTTLFLDFKKYVQQVQGAFFSLAQYRKKLVSFRSGFLAVFLEDEI